MHQHLGGFESLLAGHVLADRYRIGELIGRGGMGAVFRALDDRLNREVALKVIAVTAPTQQAQDRLRSRFRREAQAAARVQHPNVVILYDYGTDERLKLDYLVTELLHGRDLEGVIQSQATFTTSFVFKVLIGAARGLAAGHGAGLIHRDVKPANLFLVGDGSDPLRQIRVLDFGIAQVTDANATLTQLTQFGFAPHSPAYASPEQRFGSTSLTPATDIYSLAATGYHLLTRQRPPSDTDAEALHTAVCCGLEGLRKQASPERRHLEQVLLQALEYEPRNRFPDAEVFLRALGSAKLQRRRQHSDAAAALSGGKETAGNDSSNAIVSGSQGDREPIRSSNSFRRRVVQTALILIGVFCYTGILWHYNRPSLPEAAAEEVLQPAVATAYQVGQWYVVLGSYAKDRRVQAERFLQTLPEIGIEIVDPNQQPATDPLADYTPNWRNRARIIDTDAHPAFTPGYWAIVTGPYRTLNMTRLIRAQARLGGLEAYVRRVGE